MGIIKKALEDTKPERDAMKQSADVQRQADIAASYGVSIDETLDADLHPVAKELLLGSLVETRDSELERIRRRHQ